MSPRTGRPTSNKKTERLEIRLTQDERALLQECADRMGVTKTEVIVEGVRRVKAGLDEK